MVVGGMCGVGEVKPTCDAVTCDKIESTAIYPTTSNVTGFRHRL